MSHVTLGERMDEDNSQEAYETDRQQEWMADQLGTPWAVEVNPQGLLVVDKYGQPVARLLHPKLQNQSLVADEILRLVNKMY